MSILIQNGIVADQRGQARADVLVEGGVIVKVGQALPHEGARVIDAAGMLVMPGFVDLHAHLRDPGQEYKETIATGTRAAVKGGFTTVCCMPNTLPVNDNASITRAIVAKAKAEGACRVLPIGAVTKGMLGAEITEMGDLAEAGCVAVSDDGKPVRTASMMRTAMQYGRRFGLTVFAHEEETDLVGDGLMNEGATSNLLGLKGIPASAEETPIARDLVLAGELGIAVHICHVSTKGGVELIRQAKKRGVPVTAETCPHYIAGTDALCEGYDTAAKVNPPLRSEADRTAIIEGLLDGTLDCIATDHAPHHRDDKMVEWKSAASGITGFETALALCWTHLVKTGKMSVETLSEKMSGMPARLLGLDAGEINSGKPADIVIVDPNAEWTIEAAKLVSKGKNTPFDGARVTGKVVATLYGGQIAYQEGK